MVISEDAVVFHSMSLSSSLICLFWNCTMAISLLMSCLLAKIFLLKTDARDQRSKYLWGCRCSCQRCYKMCHISFLKQKQAYNMDDTGLFSIAKVCERKVNYHDILKICKNLIKIVKKKWNTTYSVAKSSPASFFILSTWAENSANGTGLKRYTDDNGCKSSVLSLL